MSRIATAALAGTVALALTTGSFTAAEAAPLPVQGIARVGDVGGTSVEQVRWRRGYGGRAAGALAAGAALGLIGGALAASAAPRYGYYGGYPAYGYGYPAYSYPPAYGYAPAYGYPAYGYGGY